MNFPESYFGFSQPIRLGVLCLTAHSELLVTVFHHTTPCIPSGEGSGIQSSLPSFDRDDAHAASNCRKLAAHASRMRRRCDPFVMSTGTES